MGRDRDHVGKYFYSLFSELWHILVELVFSFTVAWAFFGKLEHLRFYHLILYPFATSLFFLFPFSYSYPLSLLPIIMEKTVALVYKEINADSRCVTTGIS